MLPREALTITHDAEMAKAGLCKSCISFSRSASHPIFSACSKASSVLSRRARVRASWSARCGTIGSEGFRLMRAFRLSRNFPGQHDRLAQASASPDMAHVAVGNDTAGAAHIPHSIARPQAEDQSSVQRMIVRPKAPQADQLAGIPA